MQRTPVRGFVSTGAKRPGTSIRQGCRGDAREATFAARRLTAEDVDDTVG
jgi:hypothetical protein